MGGKSGHFSYRLTIALPSTHTFPGRRSTIVIEHALYVKVEPLPSEVEPVMEQTRSVEVVSELVSDPTSVSRVSSRVEEQVAHIIDPIATSLTGVALVLAERIGLYSQSCISDSDPIVISISDTDILEC